MKRPYATNRPGTGGTLALRAIRAPAVTSNAAVAVTRAVDSMVLNANSAEMPDSTSNNCWECCVPNCGTMIRLKPSEPRIAPKVFAAYTLPASLPESSVRFASAANARGKLAPHKHALGNTTQMHFETSTWNVNHGPGDSDGFIGQFGNATAIMNAAHKMPSICKACATPNANCGRLSDRASAAPAALPMPKPPRNTARISEKV